jgi:2'-5' RNA ligase
LTGAAERVRAFLAVPLPGALRAAFGGLIAEWRSASWGRRVRWVRPETLHLTLRFLGDVTPAELEAIRDGVARVTAAHAAHAVSVVGVGPFPPGRRPRVVAAHFDDAPALATLAADLEATVVGAGLAPEPRRFRPHVTLGRVRGRLPADAAVTDALDGMALALDVVVLYRSELRPEGARHTALARFPLAAAP